MIRMAVLGAGGLGRGMARMVSSRTGTVREGFRLVAMADRNGYCFSETGLCFEDLQAHPQMALVPEFGQASQAAILDLLKTHGDGIDALFLALPNLPVTFFRNTMEAIATRTGFQGVVVDALKRTKAVEELLTIAPMLTGRRILHITGAGATPGFLTTVAAVAAQSFVRIESVDIHFGVGISDWEAYRATIREDFIHLPGFSAERASQMSDAEIQQELDKRNGLLELHNMEHADDIILEMAGVCARDRIRVGGLVDTRNPKKPVSTTVTVTGQTISGAIGSHTFTVSDETTMVDNVCGPALGFLLRGLDLHRRGTYGLLTSAEIMPAYAPVQPRQSTATARREETVAVTG